jgi:hypothetical protein
MSHGPTRRVRRLLMTGTVSPELLHAADHEADLLGHPYVGLEHLQLARLRRAGRATELEELRRQTPVGVQRRWWRPRGPRSALRRAGLLRTEAARRAAEERAENGRPFLEQAGDPDIDPRRNAAP